MTFGRAGSTSGADDQRPDRPRGLVVRIVSFLSLALLPIGLIAVVQTREFQQESARRSELSLLAMTGQAAAPVDNLLQRTQGVAEAIGLAIDDFDNPALCSDYLAAYIEDRRLYAAIGFVSTGGVMRCSSRDVVVDLSGTELFERMSAGAQVVVAPGRGELSYREPVVNVVTPMIRDGALQGFVLIAIPQRRFAQRAPEALEEGETLVQLVIYNREGEILSALDPDRPVAELLPGGTDLNQRTALVPTTESLTTDWDGRRIIAAQPLLAGSVYALGVWRQPSLYGGAWAASLFPLLMWLASLLVAYYAVHRLVIRHVRRLGRTMRRFATDRQLPEEPSHHEMTGELREIEDEFRQMADSILRDEAAAEDRLRERGVLLKEVHHRVKNNLQLISSIMSMQMRRIPDPQMRSVLERLQDRVLGLATIHRTLYESEHVGRVDAGRLLREIVAQQFHGEAADLDLQFELQSLELLPDQAVPLSLLVSEAVANALTNIGAQPGEAPWLKVGLAALDEDNARVEVVNSTDGSAAHAAAAGKSGRGLGMNLIQAFSAQLGGPCRIEIGEDQSYKLQTTFPIRAMQFEPQDY
ncbi:sensor histidine kinase [Pseudoroseicyclus aestuarii]|uniref:histidine kinase n=1 Tax=Pseudoroseicyclus aestuarii TaxID=1795041 RepID=A0A318SVZ3_9RHOB|nr:sensor histidine kinase [Pseudoroseicyclus aestuarii]PYE86020.1 two-component sensor histidine kinase [Pseudoroseicyclus aestuarii]